MIEAFSFHTLLSLLTLIFLEIVLGIDNLVFLSIASSRLPQEQQAQARTFGLLLALLTRLILLFCATWLASLTQPLFSVSGFDVSGRNLFMFFGGIFLLYKGTEEIHTEFTQFQEQQLEKKASSTFTKVIIQIALLDIIFSFDSVITAVGMVQHFWVMATAITIAIFTMLFAATPLSNFIDKNPSVKMLAISFILMVGMMLVADGLHFHIPRGYIYFSIAFSLFVETLNITLRKKKIEAKSSGD